MPWQKNPAMREKIVSYISEYIRIHGTQPTIRQIGAEVGLSSSATVYGYMNRLRRDGELPEMVKEAP